ncbi:MAG: prolyl oligopeptidase family serine peptidase [Myxococcales bacterium]|nr:prolyl oligopeptidase family serine peptidase [Myxococcales bacterium]
MSKLVTKWRSQALNQEVMVARWGTVGRPVLLFPTAGGDAEECERFLMLKVLAPLLEAGKIKIYSCDSVAGRAWIDGDKPGAYKARVQNQFDVFIHRELVPAIRHDCQDPEIEVFTAGASLGAFNALAAVCRHPDVFATAICMSGTYDFTRWMGGDHTHDFHVSSPLHFLPYMKECAHLERLRTRMVILATGEGRWEDPGESWRVARVLGARGVPNRVDLWGDRYDHDWVTWREMLPKYLADLT